jgi:hypothetical protein
MEPDGDICLLQGVHTAQASKNELIDYFVNSNNMKLEVITAVMYIL